MTQIALSTHEVGSLRSRIRHRLNKKMHAITPVEFGFLNSMEDHLSRRYTLSSKQLHGLLNVLERTETKRSSNGAD